MTYKVVSNFNGTATPSNLARGRGVTCGIVFGAAVHKGALPGPGIARRVQTAARLYHEGILQHIILTGGKGEPGVASEAEVMSDVALKDGIAAGDLTLEKQARSTWENLLYSQPLTGSCTTIIGISDRYHLARIAYLASVQDWKDIRTLPSDLEAPWYFEFRSISREVAALLYYMV
ncbi:MAG: YdcF family protein, partial [Candidatus Peregrinibacteria bacterium]